MWSLAGETKVLPRFSRGIEALATRLTPRNQAMKMPTATRVAWLSTPRLTSDLARVKSFCTRLGFTRSRAKTAMVADVKRATRFLVSTSSGLGAGPSKKVSARKRISIRSAALETTLPSVPVFPGFRIGDHSLGLTKVGYVWLCLDNFLGCGDVGHSCGFG